MPIIKKKYLTTSIPPYEDNGLDELVDSEGGIIGGDRNVTSNSEIETGPVQKPFNDTSDYETGVQTTTDRASRYKQDIPWFANYSSMGYGTRRVSETITKNKMEEKIEDLVNKRKKDNDLVSDKVSDKVEKLINKFDDKEFSEDELKKIIAAAKKAIENKK
jgi:hypothetical protein